MTLALNFYCGILLTITGVYQLPYFSVDQSGVNQYPKFFINVQTHTEDVQDGTNKHEIYSYPSTFKGHTQYYCDNIVNCDTSEWPGITMGKIYDTNTSFNFSLHYVDENGNQNDRGGVVVENDPYPVNEPIFASFLGRFHCPDVYETEHFRKVFTVTKPNGELFNDYSTYINFTLYGQKTGCGGSCNRRTFKLRDYTTFEEQIDDFDPIPEEPVQTESENSE